MSRIVANKHLLVLGLLALLTFAGAVYFAGCSGDDGALGDTGDTGAQGPQGNTGDTGGTGPQGDTGGTGPPGADGVDGDTGDTGGTGPQGDTGPAGADGGTGPQGPSGPTGPGFANQSYITGNVVYANGTPAITATVRAIMVASWVDQPVDVAAVAGGDGTEVEVEAAGDYLIPVLPGTYILITYVTVPGDPEGYKYFDRQINNGVMWPVIIPPNQTVAVSPMVAPMLIPANSFSQLGCTPVGGSWQANPGPGNWFEWGFTALPGVVNFGPQTQTIPWTPPALPPPDGLTWLDCNYHVVSQLQPVAPGHIFSVDIDIAQFAPPGPVPYAFLAWEPLPMPNPVVVGGMPIGATRVWRGFNLGRNGYPTIVDAMDGPPPLGVAVPPAASTSVYVRVWDSSGIWTSALMCNQNQMRLLATRSTGWINWLFQ